MENEKSYHTKQKDFITDIFKSNPSRCFTSKEIIEICGSKIGEATVYRRISRLVKDGTVQKFSEGKSTIYKYNACGNHAHFHMKCTACGELFHVEHNSLEKVCEAIAEDCGFFIDNTETTIYGVCKKCKTGI